MGGDLRQGGGGGTHELVRDDYVFVCFWGCSLLASSSL